MNPRILIATIALLIAVLSITLGLSTLMNQTGYTAQCTITSTHYAGFSYESNLRFYVDKPCQ